MKTKILLLLMSFSLSLAFSSCAQNAISKNDLVNKKWSLRSSKVVSVNANNKEAIKEIEDLSNYDVPEDLYKDYQIYGDDGTIKDFQYYIDTANVEKEVKREGTYSLEGDILTIQSDRPAEVGQAEISKNELHIIVLYTDERLKELDRFLQYKFPGVKVSKLAIKRTYVVID